MSNLNTKIKFNHITAPKPRRCTLAISVPSKEMLLQMLENHFVNCLPAGFIGKLGVAKVHPKDKYNHKVGRKLAQEKLEDVFFHLYSIERYKLGTLFKFQVMNLDKNVLKLQCNFWMQPDKYVVHVQYVDVTPIKRIN